MKELEDKVNAQRELIENLRRMIADLEIRLHAQGVKEDNWRTEDDPPTPTTSRSARTVSSDTTGNIALVSSAIYERFSAVRVREC